MRVSGLQACSSPPLCAAQVSSKFQPIVLGALRGNSYGCQAKSRPGRPGLQVFPKVRCTSHAGWTCTPEETSRPGLPSMCRPSHQSFHCFQLEPTHPLHCTAAVLEAPSSMGLDTAASTLDRVRKWVNPLAPFMWPPCMPPPASSPLTWESVVVTAGLRGGGEWDKTHFLNFLVVWATTAADSQLTELGTGGSVCEGG